MNAACRFVAALCFCATLLAGPGLPDSSGVAHATNTLQKIVFRPDKDAFSIELITPTPADHYSFFTLDGPPRLIIDVPGEWSSKLNKVQQINTLGVRTLRVGRMANRMRIVIELFTATPYKPTFQRTVDGVLIRFWPSDETPVAATMVLDPQQSSGAQAPQRVNLETIDSPDPFAENPDTPNFYDQHNEARITEYRNLVESMLREAAHDFRRNGGSSAYSTFYRALKVAQLNRVDWPDIVTSELLDTMFRAYKAVNKLEEFNRVCETIIRDAERRDDQPKAALTYAMLAGSLTQMNDDDPVGRYKKAFEYATKACELKSRTGCTVAQQIKVWLDQENLLDESS